MEILQKLPNELQSIVVSYSKSEYPYIDKLKVKLFMIEIEKYIKTCDDDTIVELADYTLIGDPQFSHCPVSTFNYYFNKGYLFYPLDNPIMNEEYIDYEFGPCPVFDIVRDMIYDEISIVRRQSKIVREYFSGTIFD
tara:strand:+ start:6400 stop:6810 length:411 start_codon:yes stop_codon:yes gene_type:complete